MPAFLSRPVVKRALYIVVALVFSVLVQGQPVLAQEANPAVNEALGTITAPPGVEAYNAEAGGEIGALVFFSRMIQVLTVVAGIWVMYNVVMAGFLYVTSSGDSGAHQKVRDKITMSVIGLVLIVAAYTITAILSLVLFGRADFILNPEIVGPEATEAATQSDPASQLAPNRPGP